MENHAPSHDSYSLYVLNVLGELQSRLLRFPDRRVAMTAAWAQLRIRPGCFAILARMRRETWIGCTVYCLADGQLAQLSEHRQHAGASSMDVHTPSPGSYAGQALRQTMDII